jgi:hypothetical protein
MAIGSGGSGTGYQYSLDGINFIGSGLFSNLDAGSHFIVVQDGSGCQNTVSGVITSAGGPTIGNLSSQNVSCFNGTDGSISVLNVTGGTGVLLYSQNGINFQTSNIFSGLSSGSYIIHVKDANNCNDTIAVTILEPNAFVVVTNVNDVLCHGIPSGSVQIIASGGAGFFAYSLNNGLNYQSGSTFNNLSAGQYSILIKDAANCTAIQSFTINQPTVIQIHTSTLDVSCYGLNDGELNILANGGVAPYLYSVNAQPFSISSYFDNLAGDLIYEVHVKDANNCISTVYRYINEPSLINVNAVQSNVSCFGGNNGAVILSINGGVFPYSFLWNNQSSESFISNLSEGIVSVQVTDLNGCNGSMSFGITQPNSPLILNAALTHATSILAMDGAIDITSTGGTPPYAYSWNSSSNEEDLTDLGVGVYMVTVTDDNGCSMASTFQITSTASLISENAPSDLLLYPNPASQGLTIDAGESTLGHLTVLNLFGQKLIDVNLSESTFYLNTSDFAAGIYVLQVTINDLVQIKHLSVIK